MRIASALASCTRHKVCPILANLKLPGRSLIFETGFSISNRYSNFNEILAGLEGRRLYDMIHTWAEAAFSQASYLDPPRQTIFCTHSENPLPWLPSS